MTRTSYWSHPMKLFRAHFDKPLPGTIAGRRLQHSVCIDDKAIERLEVVDSTWVLVATAETCHMIPMHKVASVQPMQEHENAPAKRRGRPPGSKNRKPNADDRPPTEASLSSD